jgi:hypothetical protein
MGVIMKYVSVVLFVLLLIPGCTGKKEQKIEALDEQKVILACDRLISDFKSKLKQELLAALAEGGPENAISVCYMRAQTIADSFSQIAGVEIKRVSLRQRNPRYNPDEYELAVLNEFDVSESQDRQSKTGYTTDESGIKQFRYMRGIRMGQLCLKCHGNPEQFSAELRVALNKHYPDDPAFGYEAGQSRGAFSILIKNPESAESIAALLSTYGQ